MTTKELAAALHGRNREEKQAILGQLKEYRQTHGLGCWDAVAKKAGKNVTPDQIRSIYAGEGSLSITVWRRIGHALKILAEKENTKNGN